MGDSFVEVLSTVQMIFSTIVPISKSSINYKIRERRIISATLLTTGRFIVEMGELRPYIVNRLKNDQ